MPAKSAKQYKFMQAVAHGMSNKPGVGPSKKLAEEFIRETPKDKKRLFGKRK